MGCGCQEELVFAEDAGSNGSGERQQIVYRSAVAVTPDALDALCDKARPTWQRARCARVLEPQCH